MTDPTPVWEPRPNTGCGRLLATLLVVLLALAAMAVAASTYADMVRRP